MMEFSGWEYLLIDAANNLDNGLDKKTFQERIEWITEHLDSLESLAEGKQWKERPLYLKAVMAIRDAQAGKPIGHLVGFDAVCSGMQIMSTVTGCYSGANATGLIDQNRRADAYTDCASIMQGLLGKPVENLRNSVKNAVMTSLYGSKAEPKKEFGDGTPELEAFYSAMFQLAPGACMLLQVLLDSWTPYALGHSWVLPDGFQTYCKVWESREEGIEVDELNHHTFTYIWDENVGKRRDVKNAANVVHSLDAYILRSLIRRCSYDPVAVKEAMRLVSCELIERMLGTKTRQVSTPPTNIKYYMDLYSRSGIADITILPHLDKVGCTYLTSQHLRELNYIFDTMLEHEPFPVVTIHDDFKCHPNNMNALRRHYRNILVQLADSTVLDDILTQLMGVPYVFPKLSKDLGNAIRQSNYHLT